jgi:hypothetical protein
MTYKNHLSLGYSLVEHKGKKTASALDSPQFRRTLKELMTVPYRVGTIPPGFEHRADKIADLFYGSADLDWLICWTNNVSDPFEQLNVGDRIKIYNI